MYNISGAEVSMLLVDIGVAANDQGLPIEFGQGEAISMANRIVELAAGCEISYTADCPVWAVVLTLPHVLEFNRDVAVEVAEGYVFVS